MPRAFFADAWYFIALLEPRDAHHRNALRLARYTQSQQVVTHYGVLSEVLTYFAEEDERARALAAQTVRTAIARLVVIDADRSLFLHALDFYERRGDKQYSLPDCMSMVVMRDRGLTHVFTNDHHFRQEGFTVLSDAP